MVPSDDPETTRPIDLRVRRQAGVERHYTVRFTLLDGRGLVMLESDVLVHEADLRTNGIITDLDADQVLSAQFVFVSASGTQNRKYRTWDRDRVALEALPPGSNWTRVELLPVTQDPFFILDTDTMDVPFPWRDLVKPKRTRRLAARPAADLPELEESEIEPLPEITRPTARPSRASRARPRAAPVPDRDFVAEDAGPEEEPPRVEAPATAREGESPGREVTRPVAPIPETPRPAAPVPETPRQEGTPPPTVTGTREQSAFQVVCYLRDQLIQERMRRGLLEDEIRRLEAEIRSLRVRQGPA